MRHIRAENRIQEWRAPGHTSITRATSNTRQVAVALSGGSVVLFELAQVNSCLLNVGAESVLWTHCLASASVTATVWQGNATGIMQSASCRFGYIQSLCVWGHNRRSCINSIGLSAGRESCC